MSDKEESAPVAAPTATDVDAVKADTESAAPAGGDEKSEAAAKSTEPAKEEGAKTAEGKQFLSNSPLLAYHPIPFAIFSPQHSFQFNLCTTCLY